MKKLKYLWDILNAPIVIACIVFGLTTILGNLYQQRNWQERRQLEQLRQDTEWKREKRFQILSHKLNEGQKSLNEIADTIAARLLQSRKVVEILTPNYSSKFVAERWRNYMTSVNEWNHKLILHHTKLERLVSADVAQELLYYKDDNPAQLPPCLHEEFVHFHEQLLKLKRLHLQNPNSPTFSTEQENVTRLLYDLNSHVHAYLNKISTMFIQKESDLLLPAMKDEKSTLSTDK